MSFVTITTWVPFTRVGGPPPAPARGEHSLRNEMGGARPSRGPTLSWNAAGQIRPPHVRVRVFIVPVGPLFRSLSVLAQPTRFSTNHSPTGSRWEGKTCFAWIWIIRFCFVFDSRDLEVGLVFLNQARRCFFRSFPSPSFSSSAEDPPQSPCTSADAIAAAIELPLLN